MEAKRGGAKRSKRWNQVDLRVIDWSPPGLGGDMVTRGSPKK